MTVQASREDAQCITCSGHVGAQEGEHEEELQEGRESDEKQQKKVECQVGTKGQHQTGCKRWQSEEANEQCRIVAPRNNTVGEDGAAAQLQKTIKQHNKTIMAEPGCGVVLDEMC